MTPADERHRPVAREMRAVYAFSGATEELARTVPLAADEAVLLHGAMRLHRVGRLPRPVVVRVTAQRLSLLMHYAFQPDRVWDVPRAAVLDVRQEDRKVQVAVASADPSATTVMMLRAWTGRARLDRPLRDAGALATTLSAWLDVR